MTPLADASGHCNCRLPLRRAEERLGVAGAKSRLNFVEMRPDSLRGYSGGIRITRRLPEFFGSMDLLFSGLGREQIRRFIHEAQDARGFLALLYKLIDALTSITPH